MSLESVPLKAIRGAGFGTVTDTEIGYRACEYVDICNSDAGFRTVLDPRRHRKEAE